MRFKYRSHSQNIRDTSNGLIYCGRETICDLLNELNDENEQLKHDATVLIQANQDYRKENEQLKQQMQRLYNYFADWFDDRVRPSDFSEMWDFVKEDEKWD